MYVGILHTYMYVDILHTYMYVGILHTYLYVGILHTYMYVQSNLSPQVHHFPLLDTIKTCLGVVSCIPMIVKTAQFQH